MSVEYTIDIQLTELGFPVILQPPETPGAPATPSHSISSDIKTFPVEHKQGHHAESHVTDAGVSAAAPQPEVSQCKQLGHAQSLEDGAAVSKAMVHDDPPAMRSADLPQETERQNVPENNSAKLQDVDGDTEDSEDSEVSDVCDDEEVGRGYVDEEEEGLSSESSQSGDYSCSVCHLQLPSRSKLQDHMNLHTGARPYCCAECGKRFCQTSSYLAHLRTHALPKVERHQCRVCLKRFGSEKDLHDHFSVTHLERKFYECDLCKRIFTLKKDCVKHVELLECLSKFTCDACNSKFSSKRMLNLHRKKLCHRNFKCTDCGETFTKKNALLKHSFTHLGLLPYTCVRCRQHFRLAKLYCQHKCEPERIHCVACLREFSSHEDFQQHKKDTGCWGNRERSTKTTEIMCLECGKKFNTTEELKKHSTAHQRVLKCAECWKGFRSALLLMSHMGGHAGNSPCLCQSCGLGFPHQQNYDSHLKTCGKMAPPVSASKKLQTSESSSLTPKTQNLSAKPKPVSTVKTPSAGLDKPPDPPSATQVKKKLPPRKTPAQSLDTTFVATEPVCGSSPAPQTKERPPPPGTPSHSASSDGLWKLTLSKPPPPSVDLVMFLPVCPPTTGNLLVTSAIPPNVALPPVCQTTVSAVPTNGYFGVNPAFGIQAHTPSDVLPTSLEDVETPLDLSFKTIRTQKDAHSLGSDVKSEKEEIDVDQHFQSHASKMIVKTEGDGRSTVKQWKVEHIPSQLDVETPSLQPVLDLRKESERPGEIRSSDASVLTEAPPEKKRKMEVDF